MQKIDNKDIFNSLVAEYKALVNESEFEKDTQKIQKYEKIFIEYLIKNFMKYFVSVLGKFVNDERVNPDYDFSDFKGIEDFCLSMLSKKINEKKILAHHYNPSIGTVEALLAKSFERELLTLIKKNERRQDKEIPRSSFPEESNNIGVQKDPVIDYIVLAEKFPLLLDEEPSELQRKIHLYICYPGFELNEVVNDATCKNNNEGERILLWRKYSDF